MSECHNNSPYKTPEGFFFFFFHDSDIFVFKITKSLIYVLLSQIWLPAGCVRINFEQAVFANY